ncbi:MAG TPA: hypothetical protein VMZ69_00860 [Saprospiraceae bacterium]|nr:hypothetical protein [Saprospiraceae bacterium]
MKNSTLSKCRTIYVPTRAMQLMLIFGFILFSTQLNMISAQARLSIQGILKKGNGEAVPDNAYTLTFRLYSVVTGGTDIWEEEQQGVEVVSGIYSTVLGNITPFTGVSFSQVYWLGVTVGPASALTEMTPRIQLTSAPYALSMLGSNNQVPNSGQVILDSIDVNGGVLTQLGAPGGTNGQGQNGYSFLGDKDTGLYSTAAGQVSLYVNNSPEVTVKPDTVTLNTKVVKLNTNEARINYNGLDDWRLVDIDYFQSGNDLEGWQAYDNCCGENIGWQNTTASITNPPVLEGSASNFEGRFIKQSAANQVLKKSFNLSNVGNYNYIKIKFKYYYLGCWDGESNEDNFPFGDAGFAAITKNVQGEEMRIGFYERKSTPFGWGQDVDTPDFTSVNNWSDENPDCSETTSNEEMTFYKCTSCSNTFWLVFGADLNTDLGDERFGVGMIEIWVK